MSSEEIIDEEGLMDFEDLLLDLKEDRELNDVISLQLFKKIGALSVCQTDKDLENSVNLPIINRKIYQKIEM